MSRSTILYTYRDTLSIKKKSSEFNHFKVMIKVENGLNEPKTQTSLLLCWLIFSKMSFGLTFFDF